MEYTERLVKSTMKICGVPRNGRFYNLEDYRNNSPFKHNRKYPIKTNDIFQFTIYKNGWICGISSMGIDMDKMKKLSRKEQKQIVKDIITKCSVDAILLPMNREYINILRYLGFNRTQVESIYNI